MTAAQRPGAARRRLKAPSGEDRLIEWLRRRSPVGGTDLLGDDAALLPGNLAVTVDQQIEGVHFPPGLAPARIARRLLAVNLSDLAAVGARPAQAFLALAAPLDFDRRSLLAALTRACDRHGVRLAGGDLAVTDRLSLGLTLIGSRVPRGRWLERRNARPGDRLWIGGWVGASAAGRQLLGAGALATPRGIRLPAAFAAPTRLARAARAAVLRHLEPRPQLALGEWLARRQRAGAIDISDGLSLDLHRLCRASGVGAVVDPDAVPTLPFFTEICRRLDASARHLVLHGGEDYVLLFALPPGLKPPAVFNCRPIGRFDAGDAVRVRTPTGELALAAGGWDHLRARPDGTPISDA